MGICLDRQPSRNTLCGLIQLWLWPKSVLFKLQNISMVMKINYGDG